MRRPTITSVLAAATAAFALGASAHATPRTLEEYRYFRSLSIDLNGRIPTPDEIAQFEQPDFNLEGWIDARLAAPGYAERLIRIYNDRLHLEVPNLTGRVMYPMQLLRREILGPDGRRMWIWYRSTRRENADTDGTFCFTPSEVGVQLDRTLGTPVPGCNNPVRVSQALLDARTVEVRPWWLYRDYRSAHPTQEYDPATWASQVPGFVPSPQTLTNPDGSPLGPAPTIRVCREEAQANVQGAYYAPATRPRTVTTGCGAVTALPVAPNPYAMRHAGEMVECNSYLGRSASTQCGCGVGLEGCIPFASSGPGSGATSFVAPVHTPLGDALAIDTANVDPNTWSNHWWAEEARHFLADVFANDRDFRDVVRARDTFVNGPLAQYYRSTARIMDGAAVATGPTPMFDALDSLFVPTNVPADLLAYDTGNWQHIADRGPHAAGILSMPIFLQKYGTRRARAHVLYNAFLCRDFVAGNVMLSASNDPNLMTRSGCSACHAALEPLAAFFSRVQESSATYLPASNFPVRQPMCATRGTMGSISGACTNLYDRNFATSSYGLMLGAYGSEANAEAGPPGMGEYLANQPEYATCVVRNVAESFLGHALGDDDMALAQQLAGALAGNGFRVRAMVRALLLSDAYRHANDLSSTAWRASQGGH